MWTIFKKMSLLNLLQYCCCFMFWPFGHEACGILAPQLGIKPASPAVEGEVLTTGPPAKFQAFHFLGVFKIYLFNLFIFGCVGSSLLRAGFSLVAAWALEHRLSSCGARA